MLTLEQIQAAHSKVKSGADFPNYIQDLTKLGVAYYETFVSDGHTDYYAHDSTKISSAAKYNMLLVSELSNTAQFKLDLKAHQLGKTDYATFCNDCAKSGVDKWAVSMANMTCTYFDKAGNELLVEVIPS